MYMVLSVLAFNSRRDSRGVFCSLRTLQPLAQISIGKHAGRYIGLLLRQVSEDFLLLDWLSNGMVVVFMSLPIHVHLGFIVASRLDFHKSGVGTSACLRQVVSFKTGLFCLSRRSWRPLPQPKEYHRHQYSDATM